MSEDQRTTDQADPLHPAYHDHEQWRAENEERLERDEADLAEHLKPAPAVVMISIAADLAASSVETLRQLELIARRHNTPASNTGAHRLAGQILELIATGEDVAARIVTERTGGPL